MPPLPPSLPLRPDSGPPFKRPPDPPPQDTADDVTAAPLARLFSTLERRRAQAADERAAYERERLAAIQRRRPAWWMRD
jgi:hypothetical protein